MARNDFISPTLLTGSVDDAAYDMLLAQAEEQLVTEHPDWSDEEISKEARLQAQSRLATLSGENTVLTKDAANLLLKKQLRANGDLHPDAREEAEKNFSKYWDDFEVETANADGSPSETANFAEWFRQKRWPQIIQSSKDYTLWDSIVTDNAGSDTVLRDAFEDLRDPMMKEAKKRGITLFALTQRSDFDDVLDRALGTTGGAVAEFRKRQKEDEELLRTQFEEDYNRRYIDPLLEQAATADNATKAKIDAQIKTLEGAMDATGDAFIKFAHSNTTGALGSLRSGEKVSPDAFYRTQPKLNEALYRGQLSAAEGRVDDELSSEFDDFFTDNLLDPINAKILATEDRTERAKLIKQREDLVKNETALELAWRDMRNKPEDPVAGPINAAQFFARADVQAIVNGTPTAAGTQVAPQLTTLLINNQTKVQAEQDAADAKSFSQYYRDTYLKPIQEKMNATKDPAELERLKRMADAIEGSEEDLLDDYLKNRTSPEGAKLDAKGFFTARPDYAKVLGGQRITTALPSLSRLQNHLNEVDLEAKDADMAKAITSFRSNLAGTPLPFEQGQDESQRGRTLQDVFSSQQLSRLGSLVTTGDEAGAYKPFNISDIQHALTGTRASVGQLTGQTAATASLLDQITRDMGITGDFKDPTGKKSTTDLLNEVTGKLGQALSQYDDLQVSNDAQARMAVAREQGRQLGEKLKYEDQQRARGVEQAGLGARKRRTSY